MNSTPGLGLTSSGIVLTVAGLVLRYAITAQSSVFDLARTGDLCLIVGLVLAVVSQAVRFLATPAGGGQPIRLDDATPAQRHRLLDPYAAERDELVFP
jgi:hypothetical protein